MYKISNFEAVFSMGRGFLNMSFKVTGLLINFFTVHSAKLSREGENLILGENEMKDKPICIREGILLKDVPLTYSN